MAAATCVRTFRSTANKMSGFGSELGFQEAIHEYCNSKAVIYSMATEKTPWPE